MPDRMRRAGRRIGLERLSVLENLSNLLSLALFFLRLILEALHNFGPELPSNHFDEVRGFLQGHHRGPKTFSCFRVA